MNIKAVHRKFTYIFRSQNALALFCSSGIDEADMTELQKLLTSVYQLQQVKPDKQVMAAYSREGRYEADAIRSAAVIAVQDSEDENSPPDGFYVDVDDSNVDAADSNVDGDDSNVDADDSNLDADNSSLRIRASLDLPSTSRGLPSTSRGVPSTKREFPSTSRGLNIFFTDDGIEEEDLSEQLNCNNAPSSQRPNPNRELVRYLEKKAEAFFIL